MSIGKQGAWFAWQVGKHLPIELSVGLVACLGLTAVMVLQVWFWNASVITPDIAQWMMIRSSLFVVLAGMLGAIAVTFPQVRLLCRTTELRWIVFGCYITIFLSLYSHLVTLAFSLVGTDQVAHMSVRYLQLDTALGVYTQLESMIQFFVSQPILYTIVETAYSYTIHLAVVAILPISLFSVTVLRQYLLAVMVSLVISIPMWLLVPGIAPYQLGATGSFADTAWQSQITALTQPVVEIHTQYSETAWGERVQYYSDYWELVTVHFGYAISVNPSTHVILGVLMTWYLWRVNRFLGLLGGVFSGFQMVGTMLLFQHYLIDIPSGFLFAGLAIWCANRLYHLQNRSLVVDGDFWFTPIQFCVDLANRCRTSKNDG